MAQIAVYGQSRPQSGDSLRGGPGSAFCGCAGEFDEVPPPVPFGPEADVAGILIVKDPEHRAVLVQEAEIEWTFQPAGDPVDGLQIEALGVPGGHGIAHTVVPGQHLPRLMEHDLHLPLPEGDRPGHGGKRVARNVEGQQLPEFGRHVAVKVAVHHAGRKERRFLGAPDDAVEFLPRIAEVVPVEIDDLQPAAAVDHHVPDMVVAVLEHLRPVPEQMAVRVYVVDKGLPALVVDRTFAVFLDLVVHLVVEPGFPVLLRFRGRDGMEPAQDASRVEPVCVLTRIGQLRDDFLQIISVDPGL